MTYLALVSTTALPAVGRAAQSSLPGFGRHVCLTGTRGRGISPPAGQFETYGPILDALWRQVPAGASIYCGTLRHDRYRHNEPLLYFLSGHDSGTYYWCLDAGVTTTAAVQAEMIRELEASHVEAVLLRVPRAHHEEPAACGGPGARLLDEYLRRTFRLVETWPDHRLYRRRTTTVAGRVAPAYGGNASASSSKPSGTRLSSGSSCTRVPWT